MSVTRVQKYYVHTTTGEIEKEILGNGPSRYKTIPKNGSASINIDMATGEMRDALWASVELARNGGHQLVSEAGYSILSRAKELCPVDTGALRNSGKVTDASSIYRGDTSLGNVKLGQHLEEYTSTVSFGNNSGQVGRTGQPPSEYARRVHEDLTMHHVQGKAKFLEIAWREYIESEWRPATINYVEDIRTAWLAGKKGSKHLEYSNQSQYYKMPINNPIESNEQALKTLYHTTAKRTKSSNNDSDGMSKKNTRVFEEWHASRSLHVVRTFKGSVRINYSKKG